MNPSNQSEVERLRDELENYRSIMERNKHQLDEDLMLAKQLSFWIESARFFIHEMDIWNELGDHKKYRETSLRARKSLNYINKLIVQLVERS